MQIIFHKNFKKKYKKLDKKLQKKAKEQLLEFEKNRFSKKINNHRLRGEYLNYYSIDLTGDLRMIFKENGGNYIFVNIDNHNNLYK